MRFKKGFFILHLILYWLYASIIRSLFLIQMHNVEEFVTLIQNNVSTVTGEQIMTLAQRLRKEGKEEGWQESRLEIAKALLEKGIDIRTILETTGMPFELIQETQSN